MMIQISAPTADIVGQSLHVINSACLAHQVFHIGLGEARCKLFLSHISQSPELLRHKLST
jgi:hypothetical protein